MSDIEETPIRSAAPKRLIKNKAKPAPEEAGPPKHRHPKDVHGREVSYLPNCKACIAEDRERLKAPQVSEEDMDRTIFFYPSFDPDYMACKLWVEQRYPNAENHGAQFPLHQMVKLPELQIVVVRRQASPGIKRRSRYERILKADNKWEEVEVPYESLWESIVESAPLQVGELCNTEGVSLMNSGVVVSDELVRQIAELCFGYRLHVPDIKYPHDNLILVSE